MIILSRNRERAKKQVVGAGHKNSTLKKDFDLKKEKRMVGLNYKKAGVNIDEADSFIQKIKPLVKMTERAEVLGSIGGFGGLFAP
ncbi:MAG: hypothetical protein C0168_07330, partial [Candidatus Aminicenantes bacterium]